VPVLDVLRYTLYPLTDDVLAFQLSVTECAAAAVPVPLNASDAEELLALLLNDSLPDALPVLVGAKVTLIDADCPEAIFNGNDAPETENSELLLDTDETVTAPPVAFSASVSVLLLSTVTFPKLSVLGDKLSVVLVVALSPVPLIDSAAGELLALLENDSLPDALAALVGLKVTLIDADCPEAIFKGNDAPDTANSELLLEMEETVTAPPVALSASVSVLLLSTVTLPKLSAVGETVSVVFAVTVAPVPLSVIRRAGPAMVKVPESVPDFFGLNVAVSRTFALAAKVRGNFTPLTVKASPETCALCRVTRVERMLVNSTASDELLPTSTLPKERLAGAAFISTSTPVPPMVIVRSVELSTIVRCPLSQPAAVGANVTVSVSFPPAASTLGMATLATSNLPLLERRLVILTLLLPLLVITRCSALECPTSTLPKVRSVGERLSSFAAARARNGRVATKIRTAIRTTIFERRFF